MRGWSRRRYLRTAIAGTAGGLAGCSQLPADPLSGSSRTGTYLDWLPAPGPLQRDAYAVRLVDPGAVTAHEDSLHPATNRVAARQWAPGDAGIREALGTPRTMLAVFPDAAVLQGVPVEDPGGALQDLGYRVQGTRGEFTVMEWNRRASDREFAPHLTAVREDDVVVARRYDSRPDLEAIVDARRGAGPRFHERAPRVEAVATAVGRRTFTTVDGAPDSGGPLQSTWGREEPPGLVALASGWDLDGDAAHLRMALQFEDDADARVADVQGTVGGRWLEECRDVSVTREGATVELSASIALGRFDFRNAGDPGEDGIPDAEFDLEMYLGDAVVTHAGDQPVPAEELEVVLYTNMRLENVDVERTPTGKQFADQYDVVEEGDDVTLAPDEDGELHVEWVHPETGDRLSLGGMWYDA